MIDLYSANTPNGQKIAIALEEMALPYDLHRINLSEQEQKQPAFLAINPNGRIPAIIDKDEGNFAVFESGAILLYLAEKTGQLMPSDPKGRSVVIQWLMFQMSGLGPIMGQAGWFLRAAPERIPIGIERYQNETRRLLSVLESRLSQSPYLGGEDYSIADITTWTWAHRADYADVDLADYPHVQRWASSVAQRPAVIKGMQVLAN